MMHKYFVFSILVMQSIFLHAQVGINNPDPSATLDVIGDAKVQEKLYLENPGSYTSGPNSKLLMFNDATGSMIKFDVSNSDFGPLNYVQFIIKNVSSRGLDRGFDTKISAAKYTVAVHGSFFDQGGNRSEEHTSELQSRPHLVCRLLLEKKKKQIKTRSTSVVFSCGATDRRIRSTQVLMCVNFSGVLGKLWFDISRYQRRADQIATTEQR